MTSEPSVFELSEEYIELIKLLKLLNMVESGSEAKWVVDEGLVSCNDEIEYRKRKKLRSGDTVTFNGQNILIK